MYMYKYDQKEIYIIELIPILKKKKNVQLYIYLYIRK